MVDDDQVKKELSGTKVRTVTAENDYVGWVKEWDTETRSLILYDAVQDGDERRDVVVVNTPLSIERLSNDRRIDVVETARIEPSRYSARDHDVFVYHELTRAASERGHLLSYPIVRSEVDGSYELISGHSRVRIASKAGLDEIPVRIVNIDDWEATVRFVREHYPLPENRDDPAQKYYSDEEIQESFEKIQSDWKTQKLAELEELSPEISELQSR